MVKTAPPINLDARSDSYDRQSAESSVRIPDRGDVEARVPEFAEIAPGANLPGTGSLDHLLDVSCTVTAELGRMKLSIGEVLKLTIGSVLELNRLVSEPVEVLVQGVRVARGEVVVVDDRFAIRIKEIVDSKKKTG